MGGKQKQAQRVKNNARPSNSGRSAEFLSTTTTIPPFNTMKETGFTAAAFSLTPIDVDLDASVDSNFQLVFKKMNKKDTITKLKALQEFTELVKNTEAEAVKAILPFWPRLYCVLATDTEHRVREATHIALNQIVLKAKRNLAPYLKQLAGPWFTSQCDTYAPAATAAGIAFKDAFPVNKQQEAIVFCQEEILNYICDNLTVHTADTLSNPNTTKADKREAKFERVLISSLQGYSLYLRQLSSDSIKKVEELNRKIVTSPKFWKLARNPVAQIRVSWFNVLATICEYAGFLLVGEEVNVVKAVFTNLEENDPTVQSNLWESVLLTTKTIENWWNYYNVEDKLLTKLWIILRAGGHGSAVVIYPNLLPLMSHLPPTLNNEEVLPKFFDSIAAGLRQTCARTSQSESRAICVAFIECLQYQIIQNHSQVKLCENLIKNHLISLLDSCLIDPRASHKVIFNQVALMVQQWHRNKDCYGGCLAVFWSECETLFIARITEYAATAPGHVVHDLSSRQIDLLICLKHTVKSKQFKVKFTTEDDADNDDKALKLRKSKLHKNLEQDYLDSLHLLVYNVCVFYIKIVDCKATKKLPEMIECVVALTREFESDNFVQHLKSTLSDGASLSLLDLVFKWINNELLCTKSAVDFVFLLMKYANDEEMQTTLEKCLQVNEEDKALGWCIALALSHPHNTQKSVQKWLRDEKIGAFFIKITKYEIEGNGTSDLSLLLKQAFTETRDGQLFITQPSVDTIIIQLNPCLTNPTHYQSTIDTVGSLAAYIASTIYQSELTFTDDLFLALFTFSCKTSCNSKECDYLSMDTRWEVSTAWQDALSVLAAKLSNDSLKELSAKCVNIIETMLQTTDIDTKLEQLAHDHRGEHDLNITDVIIKYLLSVEKSRPLFVSDVFKVFFEREHFLQRKCLISNLCEYAEYFGHTICRTNSFKIKRIDLDDFDAKMLEYFAWKVVEIRALSVQVSHFDEENDEEVTYCISKLIDESEQVILELIHDSTMLDNIRDYYFEFRLHKRLCAVSSTFDIVFRNPLKSLDCSIVNQLGISLNSKLYDEELSHLWIKPAMKYYYNFKNISSKEIYTSLAKNNWKIRMHFMQGFRYVHGLSYDDVEQRDVNSLEQIVTLTYMTQFREIDVQIANVFCTMEKVKDKEGFKFYNLSFEETDWEQVQVIIEFMHMSTQVINVMTDKDHHLSRQNWDFIIVSLGSWSAKIPHLLRNIDNILNPQIASFISTLSNLYVAVKLHFDHWMRRREPTSTLIDEWDNVFVKSITSDLVQTWLLLSEKFVVTKPLPMTQELFLRNFGPVIEHLEPKYVFDARIEGMPKWSKLLKLCIALLTSSEQTLQLWSYKMLKVLSTGLVQVDAIAVETNSPHEKGLIIEQFKDLLVETQNIVSTMLQDFKLGVDSCCVESFTDSYTYTFAYLLLWHILLRLCELSSTELRYQYSDWLRTQDFFSSLLISIFKLMDLDIFITSDPSTHGAGYWCFQELELPFNTYRHEPRISELTYAVYGAALAQLPAAVRQWWSNADARTSHLVARVTMVFISPSLCRRELAEVAEHENKFKNLVVKVRKHMREVVAVYTVDEAEMELVISLPQDYPLRGPDVQCYRQIGGLPHKQWLMQLRMCVMHQNGRIWDALSLWNNNLDKKFDEVEECYICFAVLHPGTYQLPKLSCKTCRKKFHAACLYKWFSTSNKSTCPICRNLF